tara:strand:- start:39673 stop:40104 length:432 start_codon:yes stop_codon:yes gene_type:complete
MTATVGKLKVPYNKGDNERLDKFIDLYIDYDGDNVQAWKDAGYSESNTNASMAKLRQHWDVVQARIVEKMGRQVPQALAVVVDLMMNARNDSIRLKAAQDLLGRAGYDQASKIELTEKKAEDMDHDALREELTTLMRRANGDG